MVRLRPLSWCVRFLSAILYVNKKIVFVIFGRESLFQVLWEIGLTISRSDKPRALNYPPNNSDGLELNGIKVSPIEKDLDKRRKLNQNESDNVLIYGCNIGKKQRLVVRLSTNGQLSLACLFLRLSNNKCYTMPNVRIYNSPRTGLDSFTGNGLRIRCLSPLRKWHISFVGILEETDSNGKKRYVNAKLGFYWTSSSFLHDLQSDISNAKLAEFLASQKGLNPLKLVISPFVRNLDCFVQAGNMIGSVTIDGEEEEQVTLWGARRRSVEVESEFPGRNTEIIAYTKDGQMFHFGSKELFPYPNRLKFGFVVLRNSLSYCLSKILFFCNKDDRVKEAILSTGEFDFRLNFGKMTDEVEWPVGYLSNNNQYVNVSFSPIALQDDIGEALVLQTNRKNVSSVNLLAPSICLLPLKNEIQLKPGVHGVVSLSEIPCHHPSLTGGKGSSLASLYGLKNQIHPRYEVPNAVVVTTLAYEQFSKENDIYSLTKLLESVVWKTDCDHKEIEQHCERVSQCIGLKTLPATLKTQIEEKLQHVFGVAFRGKRFAVRSSASGEDSEDMSAAGQMKTFLGLVGMERIIEAVVHCWASQFSFTAVQYKRQNGQELNTPMAVVIQEMVPADTAGVLFTCDPVTGNTDRITITCNYGIGESVVSASADPDTIVFNKDVDNNLELKSVFVGGKNSMTIMTDENGVQDSSVDENKKNKCSLSVKNAQSLAEISTKIQEAYGCPVDLEWAVLAGKIYVLQARPITTLDKETEFQVIHDRDSSIRSEEEYFTRANVGEVMNGPASIFGANYLSTIAKWMFTHYFEDVHRYIFVFEEFHPNLCAYLGSYVFIGLAAFALRFFQNGVRSVATESTMIAGFGKILDDQEMLDQAHRRNKYYPQFSTLKMLFFNIKNVFLLKWKLYKSRTTLRNTRYDLHKCENAYSMYVKSLKTFIGNKEPFVRHCDASVLSSFANNFVMTVLVAAADGKWTNAVFSDFALILSSCKEVVESATVPAAIEDLSRAIKKAIDVNEFKRMTKKSAVGWLKSTKSEAGVKYQKFIETHGHRGINEFDVYQKTWEMDEIPLIQTLQEMVGTNMEEKTKSELSTADTIKALTLPLNFRSRMYLKLLIPICRRQVACREMSKSLYIYSINKFRHACWATARQMVVEGRLPNEELFFFLSIDELFQLFETRNPKLVQKAIRRKEIFPKLKSLEFNLITKGYPDPITYEENEEGTVEATFTLSGTPVSQGFVKGVARVAVTLEEAKLIQRGEILIAKGTDIGWSPYFPMLGGVATELGGLVSHGAVVAREYGLPCIVGVDEATRKIKTGDLIILDANKGVIQKLF